MLNGANTVRNSTAKRRAMARLYKYRSFVHGKMNSQSYLDLPVYQLAFNAAMQIFEISKTFPADEQFSLTDNIRRSSRSVCANLVQAWCKRRYEDEFVVKLNDLEAEVSETQTLLDFAVKCGYINPEINRDINQSYKQILEALVNMIKNPSLWLM